MRYFIIYFSILLTGCFSEPPKPSAFKKQYSSGIVKAAALSDDGTFGLTADNQATCIWNNRTRAKLYPCISNVDTTSIELSAISANNQYFILSNRLSVGLYQLSSGKLINQWFSGSNIINDIDISDDGLFLLLGYRNGEASVINTTKNQLTTFKIHELDINSVSLTSHGDTAFTGSSDKNATMWNTKTGEIISLFKHRTRVNHVDISLNGKLAISLDAINDRFLWDLTNKTKRTELNTNLKFLEFNNTAFTSDTNLMLSGSPNRKLQLWRTSDGELIQEWIANKNENRDRASVLAVSINSNNVSTINSDGMYEEFNITASGS